MAATATSASMSEHRSAGHKTASLRHPSGEGLSGPQGSPAQSGWAPGAAGSRMGSCEPGYSEHVELLPILDVALEVEQRRLERTQARGRRVEHRLNLLQVKRHLGLGHPLTEEL